MTTYLLLGTALLLPRIYVAAVELDWTSYSDRADLPMSQQWRDEMKAKLSSIDTSKLSTEKKKKFKQLWRRINGEDADSGGSGLEAPGIGFAVLVVGAALAYVWQTKPWASNTTGMSLGSTSSPAGGMPADPARAAELRELRMRRFAETPAAS
eukprot:TRINITY_DN90612_c0_g1_i1.p1 TRINITY_DN90612_c0_g1~~TRINITY_DN90612_c0_g1_i1.p1  ORF type:complete len:153 (-),score=29.76 TRINITY_DN90612_c0_g1_i1:23-481(-)